MIIRHRCSSQCSGLPLDLETSCFEGAPKEEVHLRWYKDDQTRGNSDLLNLTSSIVLWYSDTFYLLRGAYATSPQCHALIINGGDQNFGLRTGIVYSLSTVSGGRKSSASDVSII